MACVEWVRINEKPKDCVVIGFEEEKWILKIESSGSISSRQIFQMTVQVLIDKLNRFLINFAESTQNVYGSFEDLDIRIEQLYFDEKETNEPKDECLNYALIIKKEDHTLGCLLESYMLIDEGIEMIAYRKDHPLKDEIRVRIRYDATTVQTRYNVAHPHLNDSLYCIFERNVKKMQEDLNQIQETFVKIAF